jgi:hypothetical protein
MAAQPTFRIVVTDEHGTVYDYYDDVRAEDMDSAIFNPAIRDWLRRTIQTAARRQKAEG